MLHLCSHRSDKLALFTSSCLIAQKFRVARKLMETSMGEDAVVSYHDIPYYWQSFSICVYCIFINVFL